MNNQAVPLRRIVPARLAGFVGPVVRDDDGIIEAIVRLIDPREGKIVVEIGPGLGAMTDPLVARCGRLTVIELDRDLAARLRKRPELQVIESDVLKVDFSAYSQTHAVSPS